jgi:hypothetical protein
MKAVLLLLSFCGLADQADDRKRSARLSTRSTIRRNGRRPWLPTPTCPISHTAPASVLFELKAVRFITRDVALADAAAS